MKEQFYPERLEGVEGLTNTEQTLYPGVRKDIMAEPGQGEGGVPGGGAQETPETPKAPTLRHPQAGEIAPPEQRWFKEQGISLEPEKEAQKEALGRIIPKETMEKAEKRVRAKKEEHKGVEARGQLGAEFPDLPSSGNTTLDAIVNQINRMPPERRGDIDFTTRQLGRIERLVDEGRVTPEEARGILNELEGWKEMVINEQLRRRERMGRYFIEREENAILTNETERERIFEEIFVGVDANPGIQYDQALSLEQRAKLDNFFTILNNVRIFNENGEDITDEPTQAARVARERGKLMQKFSGKSEVRRILHNANWSVSMGGGDIQTFAQTMATFQSEHVDLIFTDPLVGTAMHMFEQAFQQIKAENNGQLPYEDLAWDYKKESSGLEDRVWNLMRQAAEYGVTATIEGSQIPEWRLRRAIILARGFGVISLRFPEIAAQARLPEGAPLASSTIKAERYASIYGEAIARYLDPLEHIIEKFAIGDEERAFLYFFLTGDKSRFESKEQLQKALEMASHLEGQDRRLIDVINLFRAGGPFSYSSWRAFLAMKGMTPEQLRRSGIGIREARVSGDVDDEIIEQVSIELQGRTPREIKKEIDKRVKNKTINKETLKLEKRLAMWQDALKSNPLRIAWIWEEKEHGQRVKFLREALGVTEKEARGLLPVVENDLMVIQENTVLALGRGEITYDADEMLDYSIIGGENPTAEDLQRRERVQRYVEKIREKTQANNYEFLRNLFPSLPHEESPFPFIIGMEDMPFSDFNFINAGGRGFFRRITDFAAASQASTELINLITIIPTTHNIGPLIESLNKIKQAVSQYDRTIAMDILPFIEEGLLRVYDKEVLARLPLGIGSIVGLFKDTSYVQEIFGREAMAWDEIDKFNFTRHLLQNYLIKKKELGKLRERVGAKYIDVGIAVLRTYGQLVLLLLAYQFVKKTIERK